MCLMQYVHRWSIVKNRPWAFPDLVVIEEERSELAPSKILCVICMESESAHYKLLVTRCCRQFAHIYCLRRYYSIADLCSTKDYADEVTARLYSKNCFVCRGSPEQEAPLVDKGFQVSPHFTYFPNTLMRQLHNLFFIIGSTGSLTPAA